MVIFNTSREIKTAPLTMAWEKLKGEGTLNAVDAFTEKPIDVRGESITVDVPPLNYRLLWVK